MKKQMTTALIAATCLSLFAGCSGNEGKQANGPSSDHQKLQVTTTFYPMYEFTKQVAGDKADVDLLIPSTVEPHEWDPSPKDVQKIGESDVLVYNSPYMETWEPSIEKAWEKTALLL